MAIRQRTWKSTRQSPVSRIFHADCRIAELMQRYTKQDGTLVTEGDGWCELDFSDCRSLAQIVQDLKRIAVKIETSPVIEAEELEKEI